MKGKQSRTIMEENKSNEMSMKEIMDQQKKVLGTIVEVSKSIAMTTAYMETVDKMLSEINEKQNEICSTMSGFVDNLNKMKKWIDDYNSSDISGTAEKVEEISKQLKQINASNIQKRPKQKQKDSAPKKYEEKRSNFIPEDRKEEKK